MGHSLNHYWSHKQPTDTRATAGATSDNQPLEPQVTTDSGTGATSDNRLRWLVLLVLLLLLLLLLSAMVLLQLLLLPWLRQQLLYLSLMAPVLSPVAVVCLWLQSPVSALSFMAPVSSIGFVVHGSSLQYRLCRPWLQYWLCHLWLRQ